MERKNINIGTRKIKTCGNTVYKKLLVLANTKLVTRLLASDFPSENPRPQTRNFPYTNSFTSHYSKTKYYEKNNFYTINFLDDIFCLLSN
ncbi:MAG: hypothetical protein A3F91_11575 [Flavobacteria bacterium RIFCSPLOWO2_12_FULL_35_11]|nr:MAG: hypothetical protein A3F91_11575 [Flavobacteria bacterium RIFCSPLOWO2_12_FULL_35_11]